MRIAGLHADQSLSHVLADGQRLLQVQAVALLASLPLEHVDETAGQQLLDKAAGLRAEAAEVQAGQVRVPGPGREEREGQAGSGCTSIMAMRTEPGVGVV